MSPRGKKRIPEDSIGKLPQKDTKSPHLAYQLAGRSRWRGGRRGDDGGCVLSLGAIAVGYPYTFRIYKRGSLLLKKAWAADN